MDKHATEAVLESVERRLQSTPSGSKRKRTSTRNTYHEPMPSIAGREAYYSPKRSRTNRHQSEDHLSASDADAPTISGRNVRRIKGKYSLSKLNRWHAPDLVRSSKFKEGSMNDKPSAQPPTVFIRAPSNPDTELGQVNVEQLMDDYHDGVMDTIEDTPHPVKGHTSASFVSEAHEPSNRDSGIYRFGRMVASSFNPVSVWKSWSKTFEDTRDELTIQNVEANRKKAAQKAEAERRYAEMKLTGKFPASTVSVSTNASGPVSTLDEARGEEYQAQRDSAVSMLDERPVSDISTALQSKTSLIPPSEHSDLSRTNTPMIETTTPHKSLHAKKSFFTLRRSTFSSLKKVRSELNLGGGIGHQSWSSLSPEKVAQPPPPNPSLSVTDTLQRSKSKRDLSQQRKLSQRVSNLESKLEEARRDLNEAITHASPLPELPSRFEKYTPNFKLSRPKFVPSGNLPSLPSERLILPTLRVRKRDQDRSDIEDDDNTIIDRHSQSTVTQATYAQETQIKASTHHQRHQYDELSAMDPASFMSDDSPAKVRDNQQQAHSEALDAKLNALEESHKAGLAARKPVKSKKRKSLSDDDKLFKPGKNDNVADDDDDDSANDGGAKKKKKQRRGMRGGKGSKKAKAAPQNDGEADQAAPGADMTMPKPNIPTIEGGVIESEQEEDDHTPRARNSIDSQLSRQSQLHLAPIFEEGDSSGMARTETSDTAANALSFPTIGHTSHSLSRPRSRSPAKRASLQVHPTASANETMSQHGDETPSEAGRRSLSTPVAAAAAAADAEISTPSKADQIINAGHEADGGDVFTTSSRNNVIDAADGDLVTAAAASVKLRRQKANKGPKEGFEWPEDVF